MQTVGYPMQIPELGLSPDQSPGMTLSEQMMQTLALLCGYWQNQRVLLKASPSGSLFVTDPQLQDVLHITATSGNFVYQGSNVPCSSVLIMGYPTNASKIWVRTHEAATVNNSWPLNAGDVMGFGVTNLNMLHLLIVGNTEKAIIAYTL